MRILLLDDHVLFAEAFASAVLEAEFEAPIIYSASTLDEAVALIDLHETFDLALIDLGLRARGGMGSNGSQTAGLDLIDLIVERAPETPVAVVSGSERGEHVREAWRRGARGYLPKTLTSALMRQGLRAVCAGGQYVPPHLVQFVPSLSAAPVEVRETIPEVQLTGRQLAVLALVEGGLSNKAIARELNLEEGTVKQYVYRIFRLLDCNNRAGAIKRARELGLLQS